MSGGQAQILGKGDTQSSRSAVLLVQPELKDKNKERERRELTADRLSKSKNKWKNSSWQTESNKQEATFAF